MANAQVEKLKALGLRHGEKAVVTLAGVLCLLFLFFAVTKKTIDLTPDQVNEAAKQADSRLATRQPEEDVLKQIEEQGIKNPGYLALVEKQSKEALVADVYKPARPWVTPEPGAGLIRDTPQLIAATDLFAYPGRGGAMLFELDEEGKRILDKDAGKPKDTDKASQARRGRANRRRSRMMMGGSSSMMAGMMGMAGMPGMGGPPPDSPEAKKEAERKRKELQRQIVGKAAPDEKGKEKEGEAGQEGPYKEKIKGLRWVVITGVLDHKKMRDNYLNALKRSEIAHPNYKQLNVQRQVKGPDGKWPEEWEDVNLEENHKVTYNLTEEEEELTPEDVRLDPLVDPLPFLKAGYWERVHVASLVPKEKLEVATPAGGMMGMGGMAGGSEMMPGSMAGMAGMAGGKMGSMAGMAGMAGGSEMMGGMMGMGGMGGGGEENTNFPKSEKDTIMVRSLDFTAEPDTTYRYRVQVVVWNPNYKREDVSPGTNTTDDELKGPWSEPTNEVTMPADVAIYAMAKAPGGQATSRRDQIEFQVVRWRPEDGVTVTRSFEAGPGEVVGGPRTTPIPNSDGEKMKNSLVDYNSHLVVVDAEGGPQPINQLGVGGAPLDVPAVSLVMRPDGTLVVRDETKDLPDPVRKDMDETYKREKAEAEKGERRQSSMGGMMGMMMGSGRGGR